MLISVLQRRRDATEEPATWLPRGRGLFFPYVNEQVVKSWFAPQLVRIDICTQVNHFPHGQGRSPQLRAHIPH